MIKFERYGKDQKEEALQAFLKDGEHTAVLRAAQSGERCFSDSLGWLHVDEWASGEKLSRLEALAAEIREKADVFVLIGVGGSNNAARSVIEAFRGETEGPEIIYAGNTLSPHALRETLKQLEGKSVYIDCIAKNFETLEPGAAFRMLRAWLYQHYGEEEAAKRIIATGTKGSSLEKLCEAHGYTFLEFPLNVGGRYTALTNVGLLPMAVAGVDIRAMAEGAKAEEKRLRGAGFAENDAYQYAACRNFYYQQGYRIEMLSCFEPQLRWFYKWWIQLFAESEGKEGKGIFPVASEYSEELHSVGQFVQDGTPVIFETFLTFEEQQASLLSEPDGIEDGFSYLDGKDFWQINKADLGATIGAHADRIPCGVLKLSAIDAKGFGELFYFFAFACYISCRMMGVNPFDQPGVEAYKVRMFEALGKKNAG